jgi:hypothetical protein
MVDEAYKQKAEHLLNLADSDQDGYLGKLTPTQQALLDRFREMVCSKVLCPSKSVDCSPVLQKIFRCFLRPKKA